MLTPTRACRHQLDIRQSASPARFGLQGIILFSIILLSATCGAVVAQERETAQQTDAARPNVLLLITDDQRFDMMGNVNANLVTPEMDRLAAQGVRFDHAYVTTPICHASRASILSGLFERTHRTTFRTPPLASEHAAICFPKLLRESGYRTGYVGKFGVSLEKGRVDQFYDEFMQVGRSPYWKEQGNGVRKHATDIEGEQAIGFLRRHTAEHAERPFCLTVGFNAPHAEDTDPQQYFWQDEVDHLYRELKVAAPPLSDQAFFDNLHPFLRGGTMNRHRWQWRFNFANKRQDMTRGYYRMISGVDLVIGRIRKRLDELKLADNTVVILIGDNGYFLGERGYAGKWLPYDQSIHVPLIVMDPRNAGAAGKKRNAFALNIDLAPTILELAGLDVPVAMQGRSLLPMLTGDDSADSAPDTWREDFFVEHLMMEQTIRKHEGVRERRYRYSRYFEAQPEFEELYDLESDPLETVNLINSPAMQKVANRLRRRTDELRDSYGGRFSEAIWKAPR